VSRALRIRLTTVLLAVVALGLVPALSAALTHSLKGDLLGEFQFGPCPAGVPSGALCLHDHVSGAMSELGRSSGEFDVDIDGGATGPDGCAPANKHGFFVAANGDRVQVTAHGRYCYATSSANYTYTITGGTGRFRTATGTGTWVVPQPSSLNASGGSGDEQVRGTIAYPGPRGRLSFGSLGGTARHTLHGRMRVRVFSNDAGLHGVVVSIHRGSSRGPVLGRSGAFTVSHSRIVSVQLAHPLGAGGHYVAVAIGRDGESRRIGAARYFGLRR
jgi:hypothetical protein